MSGVDEIRRLFPALPPRHANLTAPLVLAYIGDTVYDLYVRTLLVHQSDATAHGFHVMAAKLVNAGAQAEAYYRVANMLTAEETAVYKRGRNAHMGSIPKNASIAEYRAASGLEAVLGYLFLSGQDARISTLMQEILTPTFTAVNSGKENES